MTMSKRRKPFWTRVHHFFLKFNMCKCVEPKYEVLEGILKCHICNKPVKWEAKPQ